MNKFLGFVAGIAMLVPFVAGATAVDACDQQFVHEGGGDYSDTRMVINVHNSSTQIDATSTPGYAVIEVFLAVDGDGHTGYWQYASGPVTNFNPPGDDITGWKVRVVKQCEPVDVCPNIDGVQATVPEDKVLVEGACVDIVPPPLTCDTGFHVSGESCVQDEVATSTPPVDEGTSTPPTIQENPNNPQPNQTGGGHPGGIRHCIDTNMGRYCPPGVIDTGLSGGTAYPLSDLSETLMKLYNILYDFTHHDFKG